MTSLKTFRPEFVAFLVFSGSLSSFIFTIFDSETLAKCGFTPANLFYVLWDNALSTRKRVNNAALARDSEPIRLLE